MMPPCDQTHLLAVARGDVPASLLLKNARLVNVFSGLVEPCDIALAGDRIAGVGDGYVGAEQIDLRGAYVAPGLIDAHVHIESSLCAPPQYAAAVAPRGVTTAVIDPHEIANVAGLPGIEFMAEASRGLPLNVVIMASSCVPATSMATSGASLDAENLAALRRAGVVTGLAEVMNFPDVISGDDAVLAKLRAFAGTPIDGHCPQVRGKQLNAYASVGIDSDHECVDPSEAAEKLARGMYIFIREATNARNLDALLPLVTPANCRRICFCTDDRQPADLLDAGGIDYMIRRAIGLGIDPVMAIQMATLNPAERFGLKDVGAVSPGRRADLMIFDDLAAPTARMVVHGGEVVARDGALLKQSAGTLNVPEAVRAACRVDWSSVDISIAAGGRNVRAIRSIQDQLVTENLTVAAPATNGQLSPDISRDLLKMIVIERHRGTGNIGLGFIEGFGFKRGAIAGTVAHDHHNLVAIGCDDLSILTAAKAVARMGGGLVVADSDRVLATLALPIAGLMSDRPISDVRAAYDRLLIECRQLGSTLHDPLMAMSFMALEVIPELKLTDQGLIDVHQFRVVDLFV